MTDLQFTGKCWVVGDFVPTDQIVKSHRVFLALAEMAQHVLEDANPAFAAGVKPGDVLVAGRHFGQSSGRAIAVRALRATGISCVVAESFARTFYRNAFEVGLPILEVPNVRTALVEGDMVEVNVPAGQLSIRRTGQVLQANPTDPFLLEMLRAGGVIAIGAQLAGGGK
ncbi:MAG: 3-isopropylmalate dehydratase small subunit [Steroidobacteraceae bacterium]